MMAITTTTTATQNPSSLAANSILADYELHHSHIDSSVSPVARNDHRGIPNPPVDWDTTHRRVPPYRSINRDRNPLETRVYTNRVEQIFIAVMFTGVLTIAVSDAGLASLGQLEDRSGGRGSSRMLTNWTQTTAKMWHRTFGKLNDGIFRYRIGGEL